MEAKKKVEVVTEKITRALKMSKVKVVICEIRSKEYEEIEGDSGKKKKINTDYSTAHKLSPFVIKKEHF